MLLINSCDNQKTIKFFSLDINLLISFKIYRFQHLPRHILLMYLWLEYLLTTIFFFAITLMLTSPVVSTRRIFFTKYWLVSCCLGSGTEDFLIIPKTSIFRKTELGRIHILIIITTFLKSCFSKQQPCSTCIFLWWMIQLP